MTNRPQLNAVRLDRGATEEPRTAVIPRGLPPPTIIKPARGWSAPDLAEIWHYRELLYFLTWREIKVRYKQTTLGTAWAVLQPFLTMVVFSILFGALAGLPSDGTPYPVFSYAALLPWTFFASAINRSGTSLVNNSNLISKVYFPRIFVPMASVLAFTADLFIAFVVLLGTMWFYGVAPGVAILSLPLFTALALLTALGIGFWLAALNVKYRDIAHALPFLTQLWLFLTPVAYSISMIPEQWRLLYGLNPMVAVVEGFRWALLGTSRSPEAWMAVSAVVSIALFVSGLFYFRQTEREFADVV